MGEAAHQVAGCNLLSMLELLLAQATLIIHWRHLQQDQAFRQPLRGQGENMRAPVDHQRDFVIGKALSRLQALLHQADVQGKITQQLG